MTDNLRGSQTGSQKLVLQNTLGIIGGMSWESTQTYYQLINQGIKQHLGGLHSADLLIHSLDFDPIADLQKQGDWQTMTDKLVESGQRLKLAGAKGLLIATNTMHKVADEVSVASDLPLIHIADVTARAIKVQKVTRVILLGTNFTMTQDFYKQRLMDAGIDVVVPMEDERNEIHRIIYEELCLGIFLPSSGKRMLEIIERLVGQGAEGVILGCTEIGLLIKQPDTPIAIFDTTAIHAQAAVDFLLNG